MFNKKKTNKILRVRKSNRIEVQMMNKLKQMKFSKSSHKKQRVIKNQMKNSVQKMKNKQLMNLNNNNKQIKKTLKLKQNNNKRINNSVIYFLSMMFRHYCLRLNKQIAILKHFQ